MSRSGWIKRRLVLTKEAPRTRLEEHGIAFEVLAGGADPERTILFPLHTEDNRIEVLTAEQGWKTRTGERRGARFTHLEAFLLDFESLPDGWSTTVELLVLSIDPEASATATATSTADAGGGSGGGGRGRELRELLAFTPEPITLSPFGPGLPTGGWWNLSSAATATTYGFANDGLVALANRSFLDRDDLGRSEPLGRLSGLITVEPWAHVYLCPFVKLSASSSKWQRLASWELVYHDENDPPTSVGPFVDDAANYEEGSTSWEGGLEMRSHSEANDLRWRGRLQFGFVLPRAPLELWLVNPDATGSNDATVEFYIDRLYL